MKISREARLNKSCILLCYTQNKIFFNFLFEYKIKNTLLD